MVPLPDSFVLVPPAAYRGMNPLTQIKNTQKASQQEIARGVGDSASWHARFKHSAYIFTGGLSYDLTEGDLLAVFSQYGEIVDVNLVRDKDTGAALRSAPPLHWHTCRPLPVFAQNS